MKRLVLAGFALLFAFLTVSPLRAMPQSSAPGSGSHVEDGALKDIQGVVKADGDKLNLVADEDGKIWSPMNPQMLKGYEGQHVEINGHVYPSKGSVHVHTVKKLDR